MLTEDKIKVLLQSKKLDRRTREMLQDMQKKSLAYGTFTPKQGDFVSRIYENITKAAASEPLAVGLKVCERCNNVGVLNTFIDGTKTLCLCSCPQGLEQPWDLPSVLALVGAETSALAAEDFKPRVDDKGIAIPSSVRERIAWWKEVVKLAEEFWKSSCLENSPSVR